LLKTELAYELILLMKTIETIMAAVSAKWAKAVLLLIVVLAIHAITFAQNTTSKSRVAVVSSDTKTNIWISDFPKHTSVVVSDTENNLLSVISTNAYGAAFITLPTCVKTGVIVKTVNGEISASNKAVIQDKKAGPNVAATSANETNKA
jgi:ligand-binding sensor domain-containing protein